MTKWSVISAFAKLGVSDDYMYVCTGERSKKVLSGNGSPDCQRNGLFGQV